MNPRIDALCDLAVAESREYAGLHRYDGVVQDLSPAGVRSALSRVGQGPVEGDRHDEAHLRAAERAAEVIFGEIEEHRRNPLVHLANLDVACYDREYAPAEERAEARRRHLAAWPDAVDASIEALDRVPAPVARAMLSGARGLAAGIEDETALAAQARFVVHLEHTAEAGPPETAIGAEALARFMGEPEAMSVDLGRLSQVADAERDRLRALLVEACHRYRAGTPPSALIPELVADHPGPEGIYAEARLQIEEATRFTIEHDLLPDPGGQCNVGPAPESRRWAMAMMSWAAPHEADAPSWYHVTPPDPAWPEAEQENWLAVFSATTLPAITVHEVTPGHYAHGRMLRRLRSDVRRTLYSLSFVEGWAHYAEELMLDEGFRADDPRYAIGVCVEALIRVTRLACAIGIHTGQLELSEATARFEHDAFLKGPAARAEAERATYDYGYGRYTWGKLEILSLRDEALARWASKYSHRRFHDALMALGSPPLGLMGTILD